MKNKNKLVMPILKARDFKRKLTPYLRKLTVKQYLILVAR